MSIADSKGSGASIAELQAMNAKELMRNRLLETLWNRLTNRSEIWEKRDAMTVMMTDYEVMLHLEKQKERKNNKIEPLATVTYEALKFLKWSVGKTHSPSAISSCVKALKPYKLKKRELLMMSNRPPTGPLEMQLIVTDDRRLTDEQVEEILQIVASHYQLKRPAKKSTDA